MIEYKKGIKVKLISGGPIMTTEVRVGELKYPVRGVVENTLGKAKTDIKCTWFEGTVLKYDYFSPEMLEEVA